MRWRYRNEEDNKEENTAIQIPNIIINSTQEESTMIGNGLRVLNNKILFYADIDESTVLELNKVLFELDTKLQSIKSIGFDPNYDPIIHLHLNTYGGSIFAAFSTVDTIRRLKSKVHTHIDGSVASAGTLISASGHKRYMGKHAHLLIHQLSSGVYGKFSEMEDEIFNCTNLMKLLKDFYKKTTKIPMKKLDELLKRDIWLNAEECLEFGVVDEII
jgi:ATP-dependent Clp endopeptidase proteolytic subunit ClpP